MQLNKIETKYDIQIHLTKLKQNMLPRQIATKKISCDKLLQKVAKFPWPPLCATTPAGKNADTPN